jgi:CRISPR-associated endonuclease Cas2
VVRFVFAYDISESRRRSRVQRYLDKRAKHWQKSVFLYKGSEKSARKLLEEASSMVDEETDCIQAWKLAKDEKEIGQLRGHAKRRQSACVVLGSGTAKFVEGAKHERSE